MDDHWPMAISALSALGSGIVGYLGLRLKMQYDAMNARLKVVEVAYRNCQEHMEQPWPSDAALFLEKVKALKKSMNDAGRDCTMEDAARVLKKLAANPTSL